MVAPQPPHAGIRLGELGWDQGSLFRIPNARSSFLSIDDTSGTWLRRDDTLGEEDFLVVVSQACEIIKKPGPGRYSEPYVEVARAFWTDDRALIRNARLKSIRYFCLQRRSNDKGDEEGLIVDSVLRIQIRKESLLRVAPDDGFADGDGGGPERFRRWLGDRYSRQPIPDHLVDAVQRPIVDGIEKLSRASPHLKTLDAIQEIIYYADDSAEPYEIRLRYIPDEKTSEQILQVDVDRLTAWIDDQLRKLGRASVTEQEVVGLDDISVREYLDAYDLPLDSYSLSDA